MIEAWDLIIGGVERATGFNELIDLAVQREILTQQSLAAAAGDPEAMQLMRTSSPRSSRRAADGRHGDGYRPADHDVHGGGNPRDDPVPAAATALIPRLGGCGFRRGVGGVR